MNVSRSEEFDKFTGHPKRHHSMPCIKTHHSSASVSTDFMALYKCPYYYYYCSFSRRHGSRYIASCLFESRTHFRWSPSL